MSDQNAAPLSATEIEEMRAAVSATAWDEKWEVEEGQIVGLSSWQAPDGDWVTDEREVGSFDTSEDMNFAIACQPARVKGLLEAFDGQRAKWETAQQAQTKMAETLEMCADAFDDYARKHAAKGTPEGDLKAKRNAGMAWLCRAAIGQAGEIP